MVILSSGSVSTTVGVSEGAVVVFSIIKVMRDGDKKSRQKRAPGFIDFDQ